MTDTDRLTAFLYILMRDHLPSGIPEEITMKHVELTTQEPSYSNPFLHLHASKAD